MNKAPFLLSPGIQGTTRWRDTLLLGTLCMVSISSMLLLNDIVIHIRLEELESLLQIKNVEENRINHVGLVMKYVLGRRQYRSEISRETASLIELRTSLLFSRGHSTRAKALKRYRHLSMPTRGLINGIRILLSKPPLVNSSDNEVMPLLDEAYYFERTQRYSKAIPAYYVALGETGGNSGIASGIILHIGFCHAMRGDDARARRSYYRVINEYSHEPAAVIAAKLLRYLDSSRKEIARILASDMDPITKSEKLIQLTGYADARKVLASMESLSREEEMKKRYFTAVVLDEMGEKARADRLYLHVLSENSTTEYSRLANRRLLLNAASTTDDSSSIGHSERFSLMMGDKPLNALLSSKAFRPLLDDGNTKPAPSDRAHDDETDGETHYITEEDYMNVYSALEKDARVNRGNSPRRKAFKAIRIETIEDDVYIGTIVQETSQTITIKTLIGTITLPKDRIHLKKVLE